MTEWLSATWYAVDLYERRGIRIKLFEWEDYDAAYNNRRKQDEYNEKVRESDLFLALFYKKAGKFTIEEFDVATKEYSKQASPKVYIYCKDLKPEEKESSELREFKKYISKELGLYWCRYNNRESLCFQFVMQLQLVMERDQIGELEVEGGYVMIDGMRVASINKLQFITSNEYYIKINNELTELSKLIEKAKLLAKKYPDEEYLMDDLQRKQNKYNKLKKEIEQFNQLLFTTAKRVALFQNMHITERMSRAMTAFNEGDIQKANIILDEVEADAHQVLQNYLQSKEITEQKRQIVLCSISELVLKASISMVDFNSPIEERIVKTEQIYIEADKMACVIDCDILKYVELLKDYGNFLREYAKYEKALIVYQRLIEMLKILYGENDISVATYFNNMGIVYEKEGDYINALDYHGKALAIREKTLGMKHHYTADSYNNIGVVYDHLHDNQKALEYHIKALTIYEKILGKSHPATADSYNNIGSIYDNQNDYAKALKYYSKALTIYKKNWGIKDPHAATSYNNIGVVYQKQGNLIKALEYHKKALAIRKKTLGVHPDTADSYNNIAVIYENNRDYTQALEYHRKVLNIYLKIYGEEHPFVADSYIIIATVYKAMGDYSKSLECLEKAMDIKGIKY